MYSGDAFRVNRARGAIDELEMRALYCGSVLESAKDYRGLIR